MIKSNRYKATVLEEKVAVQKKELSIWAKGNFHHNGNFLTETVTLNR